MAKVLIIDDDQTICKMLSSLVKKMGHEVAYEYTLDGGLKEALSNPYDVVFLDVQMPDGSGLDLLPKIHETPSSPEVIIMTGFGNIDGAEIAIKSGAWDYIQKTDSPKKILLPLQRVIQYREDLKKAQKPVVALKLDWVLGESTQMKVCCDLLAQAATSETSVLITGETGTGKELFARAIHQNSPRHENNFMVLDCAALPETLVESLLFGHKKGAYTGADRSREGLIAQADSGTLFLDEVGELSLSIQKVFLRVLQEHSFRPVGGRREVRSDFRLVAATNQDLDKMVQTGRFRRDLLFRIRASVINLPPLRERPEDINPLILHHLARLCKRYETGIKGYTPDFLETLVKYTWPGNVRELVNTLDMALSASGPEQTLFSRHLPENIRIQVAQTAVTTDLPPQTGPEEKISDFSILPSLKNFRQTAANRAEKEYLQKLVSLTRGNTKDACKVSGLSRSRLYDLLKRYKISIPR